MNQPSRTKFGESVNGSSTQVAIRSLLDEVRKIQTWGANSKQMSSLESLIKKEKIFGTNGDNMLHVLIENENPKNEKESSVSLWADAPRDAPGISSNSTAVVNGSQAASNHGLGRRLLLWMLQHREFRRYFTDKPSAKGGSSPSQDMPSVHLAIAVPNFYFLACFLGLYYDDQVNRTAKLLIQKALDTTHFNAKKGNCVHAAISAGIPLAPAFAAICSKAAFVLKDAEGYTPLHLSLLRLPGGAVIMPKRPASFDGHDSAPAWGNQFSASRVFDEVEKRDDGKLLTTILTMVNNNGESCFQSMHEKARTTDDRFKQRFKNVIFEKLTAISDATTALYGNTGRVKELFLNMSDFNQPSHNFQAFVDKMIQSDDTSDATIEFEETLFFVHLPDLNYVKQPCPHSAIQKLFEWLAGKQVKTIKRLRIPDSTTHPLCEAFVQKYVLDVFKIEALDWRKLDVNLDIISNSGSCKDTLVDLTLYSSGNWSVLYHWKSADGLGTLRRLRTVRIHIIQLDPAENYHDQDTRSRYLNLTKRYKNLLDKELRGLGPLCRAEIKTDVYWDYPPQPHEPEEPATIPAKHQFTSQLVPSFSALRLWEKAAAQSVDDFMDDDAEAEEAAADAFEQRWAEEIARFKEYTLPGETDKRIKVAIIDNGAERVRSHFRHMIAHGRSYVTADEEGSSAELPWWMVSDPHGTQMASLVSQMNGYCRLYIARVGKMRNDIDPNKAAEAIRWAIELKVDIISISWTVDYNNAKLESAINDAVKAHILIFCSTPDSGIYSDVWPVNYDNTISVSATDQYGHLTSKTKGNTSANIQIPGENIKAASPVYLSNSPAFVSGSSVATALAAGIASLALLLLHVFNEDVETGDPESQTPLNIHSKEGMLRVLGKMMKRDNATLLLSKMFPQESGDEDEALRTLAKNWCVQNWEA